MRTRRAVWRCCILTNILLTLGFIPGAFQRTGICFSPPPEDPTAFPEAAISSARYDAIVTAERATVCAVIEARSVRPGSREVSILPPGYAVVGWKVKSGGGILRRAAGGYRLALRERGATSRS